MTPSPRNRSKNTSSRDISTTEEHAHRLVSPREKVSRVVALKLQTFLKISPVLNKGDGAGHQGWLKHRVSLFSFSRGGYTRATSRTAEAAEMAAGETTARARRKEEKGRERQGKEGRETARRKEAAGSR